MFQYAYAIALQKAFGGKIIIDTHAFTKKQIRAFALGYYVQANGTKTRLSFFERIVSFIYILLCRFVRRFNWIKDQKSYQRIVRCGLYYQYQFSWYNAIIKPLLPINYVTGNWMSEKFFMNAVSEVRNAYIYQIPLPDKCKDIIEMIESSESVCIHIRLGDYLSPQWKDKLIVCTPRYYHQAMAVIREKVKSPRFFVFSNRPKDFEMIRNEYDLGDVIYVDMGNSDVEDMELMRNCKHFIMSNSTYSWWAQYLSEHKGKVVVAPSRYNNYERWNMTDIYQDNWEIVNV